MAIAAYFFVTSEENALRNDGFTDGPAEQRAEFYRVMPTALEALYEVGGQGAEIDFMPIAPGDETFTFDLSGPLTDWLSSLSAHDIPALIANWKASEDCPYDNDKDLNDLVTALIRLSKLSKDRGEALYFWLSL